MPVQSPGPAKIPPPTSLPAGPTQPSSAVAVTTFDTFRRATGLDIFDRLGGRGEPGGYRFTCPGVMIGSQDVQIAYVGGQWELSYTDGTGRHVGRAEDQVLAYLALIADRMGHTATFTAKPDPAAEPQP